MLTLRGLVRYHVLFVIELSTRRIEIAGITMNPTGAWMMQVARNLADEVDGFLRDKRHLILDRDPVFTGAFKHLRAAVQDFVVHYHTDPVAERTDQCARFLASDREERSVRNAVRGVAQPYLDPNQDHCSGLGLFVARSHAEITSAQISYLTPRSRSQVRSA